MPLPLEFEDRDDLETFLQEKLAESYTVETSRGVAQIIELGEQMLSFDEPIPRVQVVECSDEEYDRTANFPERSGFRIESGGQGRRPRQLIRNADRWRGFAGRPRYSFFRERCPLDVTRSQD